MEGQHSFLVYLPLYLLLIFAAAPYLSRSEECNVCSALTNLACVSETLFQVCINGLPSGPINSCPTGYVCSTSDAVICQPNTGNVLVACSNCNTCDATNTFACTSVRDFALCLGTGVPTDLTGSCAPFHVCNINYPFICGNATMGITSTCSAYEGGINSTTPGPQTPNVNNAVEYCRAVQQNGRFPVGTDVSTTCRQYIYCFVNNNIWSGAMYTCPGNTYFNSSSRLCGVNVPATCSTTVTRLALQSFNLDLDGQV